jgi:hypothetical protein
MEYGQLYWIPEKLDWGKLYKWTAEYNERGDQIDYTQYYGDSTGNWLNYSRLIQQFNHDGNPLEQSQFFWDAGNGTWSGSDRLLLTYDDLGYQTGSTSFAWDSINNKWDYVQKVNYYWRQLPTLQSETGQTELLPYPNPFTDQVAFEIPGDLDISGIEILDGNGIPVKTVRARPGEKVTISRDKLAPGVYYYRILSPRKITGKLVVQ